MKAVVILSGGQDSTTCLFWAKREYDNVMAITFDYAQRHRREIMAAEDICHIYKVPHEIIKVGRVLKGTSPLVNMSFEVEKYESADKLPGGLEKTFVPGRNILFLTLAANYAYVNNADAIVTGVSQEDFGGYPDCRGDFIRAMQEALQIGLDYPVEIKTPLINLTKKKTVELAMKLEGEGYPAMQALAYSHTCYEGQYPPCGTCHACLLREKGFAEAGVKDPIYARLEGGDA